MECLYLTPDAYDDWNRFVDSSPQATIYGKTWYLDALQRPYRILAVVEKEHIVGGMVLTLNEIGLSRNPLLCKYLGVYFAESKGNLYNRETHRRSVAKLLAEQVASISSFSYTFHYSVTDHLPFHWKGLSAQVMYTYLINLNDTTEDALLMQLHTKTRNDMGFAARSGCEVMDSVDFETFYEIDEKSFRRQGGPSPFKKDFLRNYINHLESHKAIRLFGIKGPDGTVMAVAGLIYDSHSASLVLNGIDHETIVRGANEMLLWHCIRFASAHSQVFDFEGSMLQPVNSFYRKFGGVQTPFLKVYNPSLFNLMVDNAIATYKKLRYGK